MTLAAEVGDNYPAEISGGMKSRVGIARAMAGKPKYLVYGEQSSGGWLRRSGR